MLAACAGTQRLDRRVVGGSPEQVSIDAVPVHGHRVEVELDDGAEVEGELLAAQDGEVFVQVEGEAVLRMAAEEIEELSIELRDTREILLGVWTAVGTVSTLSHGIFLIISAPIWGALGGTLTAVEAVSGDETVDASQIPALAQFARFPQGMPSAVPSRRTADPVPPGDEPSEPVTVPPGYGLDPVEADAAQPGGSRSSGRSMPTTR